MKKYIVYVLITLAGLAATWWIVGGAKRGKTGRISGRSKAGRRGRGRRQFVGGGGRPGSGDGLGDLSMVPGADPNAGSPQPGGSMWG